MLIDFHDWPHEKPIEADLCIVGAGAAGITLAREFIDRPLQVCLLESGGLDFEPDVQKLYDMVNTGLPRAPQGVTRIRQLGGSTNLWTGRCAPLDPLDFQPRPWVPRSGWPFERATLLPWYRRAASVLDLGAEVFDDGLCRRAGETPATLASDKLALRYWQFSRSRVLPGNPVRFGIDYRDELARARNLRVFLHATCTDIDTGPEHTRHVHRLTVRSLQGHHATVHARHYVLACGGIENARLLLAARGTNPAGLGNDHDQVGRCFMEHPRGTCATARGDLRALRELCRHHWLDRDGRRYVFLTGLRARPEWQRDRQLLNCDVSLVEHEDPESGTRALERLLHHHSLHAGADTWRVLRDLDEVARNALRRYRDHKPPQVAVRDVAFECHIEQAPDPDSRITLAEERDALGVPLGRMHWRLGELERRTIAAFARSLAAELGRLGLARVRIADWVLDGGDGWTRGVQDVAHHMGSTRMAQDPRQGVVNPDGRLHGTDNLYLAGSSVFPTAGCVNPTHTLVALTLRLADHLHHRLRHGD